MIWFWLIWAASIFLIWQKKLTRRKLAHFEFIKTLLGLIGFWSPITLDWRSIWSCRSQSQITEGTGVVVIGQFRHLALCPLLETPGTPQAVTWTPLPAISRYKAQRKATVTFHMQRCMLVPLQAVL